jgi:hypothetical protein
MYNRGSEILRKKSMKFPKKIAEWFLVAFFIGQVIMTAYIVSRWFPQQKRIDCSVAEFHPDYTTEMREQCRLVRSSRLL